MTQDADARAVLSEMTEITEKTIDATFHRDADLEALYRDCPTAFWLAPDADLSAPPPSAPAANPPADAEPMTVTVKGRANGALAAMLAAGPIFAALLFGVIEQSPGARWWQPLARMAGSLLLLPFTVLVGALLGLVPILFGTLLLGEGGASRPTLQRSHVWIGTGGVLGMAIAALFDAGGPIGLCLIATSILCAGIARYMVHWDTAECS